MSSVTDSSACNTAMPIATTVSIVPGAGFGQVLSVQSAGSVAPLQTDAASSAVPLTSAAPPADPALLAAKHSLRVSMTLTLNALSSDVLARESNVLVERMVVHPTYKRSRAIGLFVSMPNGELQTIELLRRALSEGKRVFVPRIEPPPKKKLATPTAASSSSSSSASSSAATAASVTLAAPSLPAIAPGGGRMRMLQVHSMNELESFPPNRWGIREPTLTLMNQEGISIDRDEAIDCSELDLIICPGVAFDSQCRRLGHGKGYYDTYLASLQHHRALHSLPPVATIAVGLDQQIVETVPVGSLDLPLDEILTPSMHFVRKTSKE